MSNTVTDILSRNNVLKSKDGKTVSRVRPRQTIKTGVSYAPTKVKTLLRKGVFNAEQKRAS